MRLSQNKAIGEGGALVAWDIARLLRLAGDAHGGMLPGYLRQRGKLPRILAPLILPWLGGDGRCGSMWQILSVGYPVFPYWRAGRKIAVPRCFGGGFLAQPGGRHRPLWLLW